MKITPLKVNTPVPRSQAIWLTDLYKFMGIFSLFLTLVSKVSWHSEVLPNLDIEEILQSSRDFAKQWLNFVWYIITILMEQYTNIVSTSPKHYDAKTFIFIFHFYHTSLMLFQSQTSLAYCSDLIRIIIKYAHVVYA